MRVIHNETDTKAGISRKIKSLESQIMNDSDLDEPGKEALLCGTATALESLDYWTENAQSWSAEINAASPDATSFFQYNVRGWVYDQTEEPLIGVSVMEKSTRSGTATDIDGYFHSQTHSPAAVLVFSYIGFETKEVYVQGRTYIDVMLLENSSMIDDPWWKNTLKVVGCDAVGAIASCWKGGVSGAVAGGLSSSASAAIGLL